MLAPNVLVRYQCAIPAQQKPIRALRTLMITHGLVKVIASDNGTIFTSHEFNAFLTANGIRHLRTASYSSCCNGMSERMMQIIKNGLKNHPLDDTYQRLATVWLNYRRMPLPTMDNMSPAELLFGRRMKPCLDLLRNDNKNAVETA